MSNTPIFVVYQPDSVNPFKVYPHPNLYKAICCADLYLSRSSLPEFASWDSLVDSYPSHTFIVSSHDDYLSIPNNLTPTSNE